VAVILPRAVGLPAGARHA